MIPENIEDSSDNENDDESKNSLPDLIEIEDSIWNIYEYFINTQTKYGIICDPSFLKHLNFTNFRQWIFMQNNIVDPELELQLS